MGREGSPTICGGRRESLVYRAYLKILQPYFKRFWSQQTSKPLSMKIFIVPFLVPMVCTPFVVTCESRSKGVHFHIQVADCTANIKCIQTNSVYLRVYIYIYIVCATPRVSTCVRPWNTWSEVRTMTVMMVMRWRHHLNTVRAVRGAHQSGAARHQFYAIVIVWVASKQTLQNRATMTGRIKENLPIVPSKIAFWLAQQAAYTKFAARRCGYVTAGCWLLSRQPLCIVMASPIHIPFNIHPSI